MAGDLAMTRFGRDRQKRSDWISAVDLAGCHAWPELEGADVIETTFLSLIGRHAAVSNLSHKFDLEFGPLLWVYPSPTAPLI